MNRKDKLLTTCLTIAIERDGAMKEDNWMHSINKRLKEIRETEAKKLEIERKFKNLRLHTVDDFWRTSYTGRVEDEQGTVTDILFQYLRKIKMSLFDNKNTHEYVYWWRYGAIPGDDVSEAFEYYLEGRLTLSCQGETKAMIKANVADRISELKTNPSVV